MAQNNTEKRDKIDQVGWETAQNMHKTFLEALRHREQEILRFMAILAPALGGFIWLLILDNKEGRNLYVFSFGTIGVLFLLGVGAVYSIALGYNYRCITLQVAKLEATCLGIREFILNSWPRTRDDFIKRYKIFCYIPYCTPPEIIKVFWLAFNLGIIGVMFMAAVHIITAKWGCIGIKLFTVTTIIILGIVFLAVGCILPIWYGYKLKKLCEQEPAEWKQSEIEKVE